MKKRHKQDREKLGDKLDAEEDKEERMLSKELDSEKEKLLREKRNRQATELSSRKDLTEEQIRDVRLQNCQNSYPQIGYQLLPLEFCQDYNLFSQN